MAIQFRRGDYDDFDKTKLQEGELAVVVRNDPNTLSGKAVYICYAAGDETQVKRLIHSEDYENDFEELSAELRTEVNEMVSGLELDEAIVKKAFEELNIDTDAFLKQSVITVATDWNTLTDTGIYHIKTTECTNCPTTNHGTLYVDGAIVTKFQIWIPDVVADKMYKRYLSGGMWSAWKTLKLTYDIGTKAQAGITKLYDVVGDNTDGTLTQKALKDYIEDTGWIDIQIFGTNIKLYNSSSKCQIRRVGKVVQLRATLTSTATLAISDTEEYTLLTIPDGFVPSFNVSSIQQGSGSNRWRMIVYPDGKVTLSRYSNNANTGNNVPATSFLPIGETWLTD